MRSVLVSDPGGGSRHRGACLRRLVLCALVLFSWKALPQTVFVPTRHWVYDYLERMAAKGMLPYLLITTRPLTRAEIASAIAALSEQARVGRKLTHVELETLRFLHQEFAEELKDMGVQLDPPQTRLQRLVRSRWLDPLLPDVIYANGRNLLSMSSPPFQIYWDPVLVRRRLFATADTLAGQERVFEDTNGFVLWGSIGRQLGVFVDVRDSRQWGTRFYPPEGTNYSLEHLGFVRSGGSFVDHDETCASLVLAWSFLTFQYGKDSNRWGPGRRGQLGLSDRPTAYDLVKIQFAGRRIKLTSMMAWLQHYSPQFFHGGHQEKALAAHRLEFSLSSKCHLAVYETVVFAGRRLEPAYLNPVMFFRSAEHYLGDRDNATIGLDAEVRVLPNTRLYGELFIDDLSTGKLGTGFYGNKTAFLLGGHLVDPCGLSDVDVWVEYARVRPFTYSHAQQLTSYVHYTTCLGHWIGPNADDLYVEAVYRPSFWWELRAWGELHRHGANPMDKNVGGDLRVPHEFPRDPEYVQFLAGLREQTSAVGLTASYQLLRNAFVSLSYRRFWATTTNPEQGAGQRAEWDFALSLNL
ncbi:MAG: capsule assembly Wzi family protein [Candidatus Oleimicrobiaceae bacterium]